MSRIRLAFGAVAALVASVSILAAGCDGGGGKVEPTPLDPDTCYSKLSNKPGVYQRGIGSLIMDHHSSIVKEQYVVLNSGVRGSDDELDQGEWAHLKGYRSLLPGDAFQIFASFLFHFSLAITDLRW